MNHVMRHGATWFYVFFLRAVPSPKCGWPRSPQVEGETSGQERVRGQGRKDALVTQPELHSWLFVTRL